MLLPHEWKYEIYTTIQKKKKIFDRKDRSILLKENKEKCTLGSAQQA